VRPHWHPLSTLLLVDPPAFATPAVLRLFLSSSVKLDLVYAGDRMWPAIRHGQTVTLKPVGAEPPARGQVVLACPDGIPDLVRIDAVEPDGTLVLRADAEPGVSGRARGEEILAVADLAARPTRELARGVRRLLIELREAWLPRGRDGGPESVRQKYDSQAPGYGAMEKQPNADREVLDHLRARVRPGGTVLVVGSGAGHECFALAEEGWRVRGIDFAPSMVRVARRGASERGLSIAFVEADLRTHREVDGSLDAVVFTYDVYSFIPDSAERVAALRAMCTWLAPGSEVLLSARIAGGAWERTVLSLRWLRCRGAWGESHTRYIGMDGVLRRSFVQLFSNARLRREVERAGLRMGPRIGGHLSLRQAETVSA
jgi:SAM-dependent methyltransferase